MPLVQHLDESSEKFICLLNEYDFRIEVVSSASVKEIVIDTNYKKYGS